MKKVFVTMVVLLIIAVAAVAGWLFQNQSSKTKNLKVPPAASQSSPTLDPRGYNYLDIDYARKTIVHSQQGIQMTDIAQENAISQEVRSLAATISQQLANNIDQSVDWLDESNQTYFKLSDFPEMEGHDMYPTHPGMASLGDLSDLKSASGRSVDELFLRLMIAHHEGANKIANAGYLKDMQFGQMINLKSETIKTYSQQIQTMKQLQIKLER